MTIYTPGPRQTVDRARHPVLGEGCAVYDNGPAGFIPDDGEPVLMAAIGLGGSSSGPPHRSWLVARTKAGERIELDTTGRQSGDRHRRRWSPLFGPGWLVDEAWPMWRPGMTAAEKARHDAAICWVRFEPDDGAPVRWQWEQMRVGRLEGREPRRPKLGKPPSAARVEWDRWTVVGRFEFRDEPPTEGAAS